MKHALIVTKADRALLRLLGCHPALERALARATVLPAAKVPPDVVTMNSRVTYVDESLPDVRNPAVADLPSASAGATSRGSSGLATGPWANDWNFIAPSM